MDFSLPPGVACRRTRCCRCRWCSNRALRLFAGIPGSQSCPDVAAAPLRPPSPPPPPEHCQVYFCEENASGWVRCCYCQLYLLAGRKSRQITAKIASLETATRGILRSLQQSLKNMPKNELNPGIKKRLGGHSCTPFL